MLSGFAPKSEPGAESKAIEESPIFELDDETVRGDDEVIRDEEMAELFRLEKANIAPTPDRRSMGTTSDPIADADDLLSLPPIETPAAPSIQRVDPRAIPLGHVDLDEREAANTQFNEFNVADPTAFIGKTVKGRYRVVEMLGEDDSGFAYLAEDRILDGKRVVVRILAEYEGDEVTADILADERVRLSHLIHPSIARVFDSGQFTHGAKFLISEHPDGLSVEDILRIHGKFDAARSGKIIRQASYAIGDVHKQGILHRDIRPANIEIAPGDTEGEVMKIVNFGVASGEPNEDNILYTAPEVIEGRISTAASDVFALGVTAHRLLTGEMPFRGDTEREILKDQKAGFHNHLSQPLNDVFSKALATDPRKRYTTAREFGDAFFAAAATPFEIKGAELVANTRETVDPKIERAEKKAAAEAVSNEPAWKMRSPEGLAEPNSQWLKIALATFVLLTLIFAAAWIYLLKKPATNGPAANVDSNANSNYDPTETPPPIRDIQAPADTVYFDNNKQNLKGDLFRNFAAFSMYYPKSWTSTGPQESQDLKSRGKFLDVSKSTADGRPQESMLVSYYASRGTYSDDASNFPALVKESNATLTKLIPGFQVVSEGQVTINNGWKAYEVKFQGSGPGPNGDRLLVWGRRLYIPAARPGVRNGFEITMLATSNSDQVKSVDDVGTKGDLASMLYTFEPGRNF